jgi:uncharacterized protein YkwD
MFKSLGFALAGLTLSACVVPVPVVLPAPQGASSQTAAASRLAATPPRSAAFDLMINDLRRTTGRTPLSSNRDLDRVAASHAAALQARGALAHRDAAGRKVSGRVRAAGVSSCGAGENLARGQGQAEDVFRDWANSPAHRSNMVFPAYANYGLGHVGDYWVLILLTAC